MKWSYRLARVAGIDVRMHVTFPLLLAFWGWQGYQAGGGIFAAIAILVVSLLFGCVLLHEFGHAFAGRAFGIRTLDITLLPIGGVARLERIPHHPGQELAIAIAGPMVNVGIAAILWLALRLPVWNQDSAPAAFVHVLTTQMLNMNLMLVAFNAIPAFPMDGGRVLRALLAMVMPHARATIIAARVGQILAVLLGAVGLLGVPDVPVLAPLGRLLGSNANPFLLFVALFVFQAAQREAAFARIRTAIGTLCAGDAMVTKIQSFRADLSLAEAVEMANGNPQTQFPVLDAKEKVSGLVASIDLFAALSRGETNLDRILRPAPAVRVEATMEEIVSLIRQSRQAVLPVVDDSGRLLGLVSLNLLRQRAERAPRSISRT